MRSMSPVRLGPVMKVMAALAGVALLVAVASPYRRARLLSFMDPSAHSSGSGYQVMQSLIGLGSGHLVGAGLGGGRTQLGMGRGRDRDRERVECFVEVDNHDNACLNGDAEECNVTDPHRHAEVVVEQPLQQQPACHGVHRHRYTRGRGGDRPAPALAGSADHSRWV